MRRSTRRKWTDEQVAAMRAAYRAGEEASSIAARVGWNQTGVMQALRGMTYGDVPDRIRTSELHYAARGNRY